MPNLLQSKTFTSAAGDATKAGHAAQIKRAFKDFAEDGALRLAAALSFYAVLSFAPLLLVVVGIAGYFGGQEAIGREIVAQLNSLIGPAGGELGRAVLESTGEPQKGIAAIILGLFMLLVGATGVFVQLQDALNIIWEVRRKRSKGIISLIRSRLISFAMVLGLGFLLLISLVLSAGITLLQNSFTSSSGNQGWLWHTVNTLASLVVMTGLFVLMFKILPDVRLAWRDVYFGALVTGILMTAGKFAIGLYLGHSSVGSAYGAAGSLVVLLVWINYSAIIVFFGAELTQAHAEIRGGGIEPKPHAEKFSARDN